MSSFPFTGIENAWILTSEHMKREGVGEMGVDVFYDSKKIYVE